MLRKSRVSEKVCKLGPTTRPLPALMYVKSLLVLGLLVIFVTAAEKKPAAVGKKAAATSAQKKAPAVAPAATSQKKAPAVAPAATSEKKAPAVAPAATSQKKAPAVAPAATSQKKAPAVAPAATSEKKAPAAAAAPAVDKKDGAEKKKEEKPLSSHASILAHSSVGLAFSLYQHMAQEKGAENILISPVVVANSLGLVALGGKSSTASQVRTVLSNDRVKDEQLHAGLAELLTEVSDATQRNVTWTISNRLYGPSSVSFTDGFVKGSKKHYNFEHSKINFRDKRSAVNSINEWAAKSTDGKLPEVTKDVDKTDGAMIINAMFYKPHWDEQFHHKMVDNRGFLVSRTLKLSLPMMHRTGMYGFHEDTENKLFVLNMPLAHKKSSLVLIMPYHVESLERLEKLLTSKQLDTWISKLEDRAVAVSLPKTSIEVSHNLQKHLGELGLSDAVDKTKADLSHISGKKDLYLSNVFHASAMEWGPEGNPPDTSVYNTDKLRSPKLFYADHPFIFLVKDTKTNAILFIGRMVRPKGDIMRDEL
ncbi:serpin H1a isoform X2 [Alosa pseudoharengus]|uniref:serpin H1a isoform X2 n=1 Tax=Alosa pseudoharengus TaxID=34774 RepID=UPI003F8A1E17